MKNKPVAFYLIAISFAIIFGGCKEKSKTIFADNQLIYGLASPLRLTNETSEISLLDYFSPSDTQLIDSITGDSSYEINYNKERSMFSIRQSPESPSVSNLRIWINNSAYSLILYKSRKVHYNFSFDSKDKSYKTVQIAGQMNDWNPAASSLTQNGNKWEISFFLAPGRYHYQLVLDGKWVTDPNNPDIVDNNIGGFNSLLVINGNDRSKSPFLYPREKDKKQIKIGIEGKADQIIALWQNFELPTQMVQNCDSFATIEIPFDATTMGRSFIRVVAMNEHGASNDLLIPLEKGQLVSSPEQIKRDDREASILYFLMVDRFNNGTTDNDQQIDDPLILPPANYKGGDLIGITKKIKEGYFEKLGINTIWLSPIAQNPNEGYTEFPEPHRKYSGYHGYWPVTLTTIDNRFGTEEQLHELVNTAHENGISVLLDYVSNHVHQNNKLIIDHPEWATEIDLPDGRKNIRLWDEHRLTTWFDTFLPSLDFAKKEVIEMMSDSALFWIQHYNLDGFRHDATKHIPTEYWQALTSKLKQKIMIPEDKRLFQIGETFGSRELIGSYVGSGLLDGQFDFNLYFDSRSVFALDNGSFEDMSVSINESFSYYGWQHKMGNITGNHDLPRFISLAGGAVRFDEDAQAAGWERVVDAGKDNAYQKLSSLTAFIMTIPGVPVIYYGDEIGLPGAGDPDSRRMMKFDSLKPLEDQTKTIASALTELRNNRLELIYGSFDELLVSPKTWAYSRSYFNSHSIIVFNKDSIAQTIEFPLPAYFKASRFKNHFGQDFKIENGMFSATLKPWSFEIITSE